MATLGSLMVRVGADTSAFGTAMLDMARDASRAARDVERELRALDQVGQRLSDVGKNLSLAITAPLAGAAVAAFKFSSDFNAAMSDVATLIPGNTSRVNELKASVQDMAIATGKSTSDLAQGLYQVISAFGDTADTAKILEVNARAAAAGMASTQDSINLTSAVTKAYGDTSAEAVEKVADLAFSAVKLGQTTYPELAASMGKVTSTAQLMAVSQEELFGVMATFTGVTGNAAEVSTQLNAALTSMVKPTKEMRDAYKQLGVESGKALIEQRGFQGALEALKQVAGGSQQQLAKMFGSVESLRIVFSATGEQADTLRRKTAEMGNSAGAVGEAFAEVAGGVNKLGFGLEQLKVRLEVAAQRMGDALAPAFAAAFRVVDPLIGLIEKGVAAFVALPQPVQDAAVAIGVVAAAIGPLVFVAGQMVQSFVAIKAALAASMVALPGFSTAATTATAATTGLANSAGLANVALTVLKGTLIALVAAAVIDGIRSLIDSVKGLAAVFESTEQTVVKTGAAMKSSGIASPEVKTQIDAARKAVDDFNTTLGRTQAEVSRFGVRDFITPFHLLAASLREAGQEIQKLRNHWPEMAKAGQTALDKVTAANKATMKSTLDHAMAEVERNKQTLAARQATEQLSRSLSGSGSGSLAGATQTVSKAVREYEQALAAFKISTSGSSSELAKLQAAMEVIEDRYRKGTASSLAYSEAKQKLAAAMRAADPATRALDALLRDLKITTEQLGPSAEDLARKTEQLQRAFDAGKITAEQYARGMEEIQRRVDALNAPVLKLAADMQALAFSMAAILDLTRDLTPEMRAAADVFAASALASADAAAAQGKLALASSDLKTAMKGLGLTAQTELQAAADAAEAFYRSVRDNAEATMRDKELAWVAWKEKAIAAGEEVGAHDRRIMEGIREQHGQTTRKSAEDFGVLGRQVSTILTDMGRGFADVILKGGNMGDVLVGTMKKIGEAMVRYVVEEGTRFIISELEGLKMAFAKLKDFVLDIAKKIGAAFGLGGVGEAAGGAAGSAAGAAGSAAGAGGMGLAGAFGLLTGVVDAIAGVLSYLQGRRMEKDIGRIEVTTRGILNQLIALQERADEYWPNLLNTQYLLHLPEMENKLGAILDALTSGGIPEAIDRAQEKITDEIERSGDDIEDAVEDVEDAVDDGSKKQTAAMSRNTLAVADVESAVQSGTKEVARAAQEMSSRIDSVASLLRQQANDTTLRDSLRASAVNQLLMIDLFGAVLTEAQFLRLTAEQQEEYLRLSAERLAELGIDTKYQGTVMQAFGPAMANVGERVTASGQIIADGINDNTGAVLQSGSAVVASVDRAAAHISEATRSSVAAVANVLAVALSPSAGGGGVLQPSRVAAIPQPLTVPTISEPVMPSSSRGVPVPFTHTDPSGLPMVSVSGPIYPIGEGINDRSWMHGGTVNVNVHADTSDEQRIAQAVVNTLERVGLVAG